MNAEACGLIVLGHTKFGENSVVVHTLSEKFGRRGFLVRTGKKAPMSLFLPMNIIEAEVRENPKSTLWYAGGFSLRHPLSGIRGNISKNTIAMFLAEVLFRAVREGAADEGLFHFCERSVLTLDTLDSDYANYHLMFLLELAGVMGFAPTFDSIAPFAGDYLKPIRTLMESPFPEALAMPLSGSARSGICSSLLRYLEYYSETPLNVRSLDVLREVFA